MLIGLGASAIGQFPDRLLQNEKNAGAWHAAIAAGCFATARGIRRSVQDQIRGRAIERILCGGGADLSDLTEPNSVRARLCRFEDAGLVRWTGAHLRLAEAARPYARVIASALDAWRVEGDARFSHAV